MDIQKIDKNFLTRMPSGIDLRFYDADEVPFEVYGLLPHQQDEPYRRIPLQVGKESNIGVEYLSASTTGGRIRFRTNSRIVAISAEWPNLTRMNHMPLSGSSGFDLYVEEKGQAHYAKSLIPSMDSDTKLEAVADLETGKERNILMHFPLYQRVDRVRIGLEPQAVVLPSTAKYLPGAPIVYYGSSITQGGCASIPGNAYPAIVSRMLRCDHVNLGFSGSCRGEKTMARYLASLPMRAFVCDYDHNAPDGGYLEATHESLFQTVREKQPELPILFLSKPDFSNGDEKENDARRSVIKKTCVNAQRRGDANVYFLDGEQFFKGFNGDGCTVDGCHPNDLGFTRMGEKIGAKLAQILNIPL